MSQTNAFAKSQNSDYVYMDLQQTNVYNNTDTNELDINFIETRNAPILKNTGEYDLSVTRFQIDSYKLPSLVVEPDLNGSPYEPNKTVHKVAIMTSGSTIPTVASPPFETTEYLLQGSNVLNDRYGSSISFNNLANKLLIGAPNTSVDSGGTTYLNAGRVYFNSITAPYTTSTPIALPLSFLTPITNSYLGQAVSIQNLANFGYAVSIRAIPASNYMEIITWQSGAGGAPWYFSYTFYTVVGTFNSLPNCSLAMSSSALPTCCSPLGKLHLLQSA